MEGLVDKYIDRIVVEYTDLVPVDDVSYDAAYISLTIPRGMFQEYLSMKKESGELPDLPQFWKETGLVNKLGGKKVVSPHEDLEEILDFLKGDVWGDYFLISQDKVTVGITEAVKRYER